MWCVRVRTFEVEMQQGIFPHHLLNGMIFGEKTLLNIKLLSLQMSNTFLTPRRILGDIKNV